MRTLLAAACLLIAPAFASAQDAPLAGEGSAGDMHVTQVTVTDLGAFGDQVRAGGIPHSATNAALGDRIFTVIFFDRCRAGDQGMCNLTVELRIVDPQGGVGEPRTGTLWQFPPPRAGAATMGQAMMGIQFGSGRLPGDYRIRVTTRDAVAGTSVTTERVLTIGDSR